jgi:hypothetical protein
MAGHNTITNGGKTMTSETEKIIDEMIIHAQIEAHGAYGVTLHTGTH